MRIGELARDELRRSRVGGLARRCGPCIGGGFHSHEGVVVCYSQRLGAGRLCRAKCNAIQRLGFLDGAACFAKGAAKLEGVILRPSLGLADRGFCELRLELPAMVVEG